MPEWEALPLRNKRAMPPPSTRSAGLSPAVPKNRLDRTHSQRQRRPRFHEPEPGSLIATIRRHCRTRLYVNPIWWTATHLAALGCEYVAREPSPEWTRRPELMVTADGRAVVIGPREGVEDASAFVDALSGAQSAAARASIIRDFLAASFTPPR